MAAKHRLDVSDGERKMAEAELGKGAIKYKLDGHGLGKWFQARMAWDCDPAQK